jgi:hypothetical protein
MLIDFSHLSTQSEHHRAELLADAENFRLARLVRKAGRRRRRSTPPSDPPQQADAPDRSGRSSAQRNDEAERRYAVSR